MELYSDFSLCDWKDAISENLRFEYLMDGWILYVLISLVNFVLITDKIYI